MKTTCLALTGKRLPCTRAPFDTTWRWPYLDLSSSDLPLAATRCFVHLSKPEKAHIRQATEDQDNRAARALDDVSPACWNWTVPPPQEPGSESAGWEALEQWQAERCAACGTTSGHRVRDHDHATGMVRGLLCGRCNVTEGTWPAGDNLFGRYRQRPPTVILGLTLRYFNVITRQYDAGYGYMQIVDEWTDNATEGLGL